jgi:hypothetical protein
MNVSRQVTLPGQILSAAISPGGSLIVVAVEGGRLELFDGGSLEPRGSLALPEGGEGLPPGTTVEPNETRMAFLDEQTLLVARAEYLREPEGSDGLESPFRTRLLAVDTRSGGLVGEFDVDGSVLRVAPVPIPPHHVLLSHDGLALICIDTSSWREVCRVGVGEDADDHDPAVDIEEEIAENGVAHDPHRGLVHVLWRYFNAGLVQSYRFDPDGPRFVAEKRYPVIEGEGAGLEAIGLCLLADGAGIAAWFAVFDELARTVDEGLQVEPRMARLGRLGLLSGDEVRFIDVHSEMERDLLVDPVVRTDEEGGEVYLGDRVGVDFYEARPIALDDGRVLLNTPGGSLLAVDTRTGRTEALHDFGSPIVSLELHRATRSLLVCCEDTSAYLWNM